MNTDSVIEEINESVAELAGENASEVENVPANTDMFIENIDANVKAISESLGNTPSEVTNVPANTDFFIENIAKNVKDIKDSGGGGGGVTVESLSVTQNGTYQEEGKAYSPVVVNVPVPEFTVTPSSIKLEGISGAVEVKPQIAVDVSDSLTSLGTMFANDSNITSITFDNSIDMSNIILCDSMCSSCINLTSFSLTSNLGLVNNANRMFYYCQKLTSINLPSSFQPKSCEYMFSYCSVLETLPPIDTSKATSLVSMFYNTPYAQVRSVYNLSGLTYNSGHRNMFAGVGTNQNHLIDQTSVDYILQSAITGVNITGNKTLTYLMQSTNTRLIDLVEASPYYQDFLNAGWTIS